MSVQALVWVIEHSAARLADRLVLLSIANHADRVGRDAFPSYETIGREAHVTPRQAKRSVVRLVEMGELAYVEGGSQYGTNLYDLVLMGGDRLSPPGDADVTGGGDNYDRKRARMSPEPSLEPSLEPSKVSRAFDEFWSAWPEDRRQGIGAARVAFRRAALGEGRMHEGPTDVTAILAGVRRFASDPNLPTGPEARFIPQAATWLNQERWEDGPLPDRGRGATVHDIREHFRRRKGVS